MDAVYFRDKAETCLRLAKGLSWNNPARGELMELAEEFERQAKELERGACAKPPGLLRQTLITGRPPRERYFLT